MCKWAVAWGMNGQFCAVGGHFMCDGWAVAVCVCVCVFVCLCVCVCVREREREHVRVFARARERGWQRRGNETVTDSHICICSKYQTSYMDRNT